jgi:hypothetical protein
VVCDEDLPGVLGNKAENHRGQWNIVKSFFGNKETMETDTRVIFFSQAVSVSW